MSLEKDAVKEIEPNQISDMNPSSAREIPQLEQLKMNKSSAKAVFTRYKNQLLQSLDDPETRDSHSVIRSVNCMLDSALEKAMDSIHELSHLYGAMGDTVNAHQMSVEIDTLEKDYCQTVDIIQELFRESRNARRETSSAADDQEFY